MAVFADRDSDRNIGKRNDSFASEVILLCPSRAGETAVVSAADRLAAQGIRAEIFSPVILLPPGTQEELLRELMGQICSTAFAMGIEIGEVHSEVTDAVTRPLVMGTAAGEKFPELQKNQKLSADVPDGKLQKTDPETADIVLAGPIGLEGTCLLVFEQLKVLQKRFPISLLARMMVPGPERCVLGMAQTAVKAASELPPMVSLGEGGFFAGLWELSKKTECGLEVDLQTVPILQETIEITDFFGISPYAMRSGGSILIACSNGEQLAEKLEEKGYIARVIGKLTDTKDKIIRNGEDVRFLDRPQTDTLALWYKEGNIFQEEE